jgi:hypothetical protein
MRSSTSAKPGGLTNELRAGSIRAASRGPSRWKPQAAHHIASWCGYGKWSPLYNSYKACVADAGSSLQGAANFGKGNGMSLIVILWVVVDFLVAVPYGIYRLARR